ncbi:hypothetical protein LRP88_14951 [Fusarium phalaenopsidis]
MFGKKKVGAGIQIPPNAGRVARQLGLLPRLTQKSVVLDSIDYVRYSNGKLLYRLGGGGQMVKDFGESWMVISRPGYHDTLWNAAKDAGVELRLGCEVEAVDPDRSTVQLVGGESIGADVIVGADGLWSLSRNYLLGNDSQPVETGDLAYRATVSSEQLRGLHDAAIDELIERRTATCWMGPGRHCVLYPLDSGEKFNLVLIRPDNLETRVRQAPGDLDEMKASFQGWDERFVSFVVQWRPGLTKYANRITRIISCIPSVLKWKLCHHDELESWTKVGLWTKHRCIINTVALLGDACHPTLPYQAQGAAMAAEDGAVLGKLLGLLSRSKLYAAGRNTGLVPEILKLYETLRKVRTTLNVQGATSNQDAFHLPDGPLQEARDAWLLSSGQGPAASGFTFANWDYMWAMLAFDPVAESVEAFGAWESAHAQDAAVKL